MATRITILPNDTNKDQPTQNSQISLALINVASTINSTIGGSLFNNGFNLSADLTTGSTAFGTMFSCNFTNQSNNIVVNIEFSISATGPTYIDVQIDKNSILNKPYLIQTGSASVIIPVNLYQQVSNLQNSNHPLTILWRVDSGTATVSASANTSVQILQYY